MRKTNSTLQLGLPHHTTDVAAKQQMPHAHLLIHQTYRLSHISMLFSLDETQLTAVSRCCRHTSVRNKLLRHINS